MNREILISYALAFASFLFRQPEIKAGMIKSVYLFGSVARGDFSKESDVDIFIDIDKKNEHAIAKSVNKTMQNFLHSEEMKKFLLLGIENEINVKYGDVKEWELYSSIQSEALVMFSSSVSSFHMKHFLVEIKPIRSVAKRNRVVRKLAGRRERGREDKGLVIIHGGVVLDSRHYIIPAEKINEVLPIFSKEKVLYELREVWM
ncbi:MAG: nucleotidyltransferase domain-containing protein [Candidatus Aenigmarchaeota archaeon]|nr:nucleotidyltransferase domain-containing protein [Candidatus Aenigmarchaeota archaeon]